MLASTVACGGRVARSDVDASTILAFVVGRANQPAQLTINTTAEPTEMVLALLRLSDRSALPTNSTHPSS
jgi:hypothetical protein